jgi:hypothetical protein
LSAAMKHLQEDPALPRCIKQSISPALGLIVVWCMRKDPADRYQSVEALLADLVEPAVSRGGLVQRSSSLRVRQRGLSFLRQTSSSDSPVAS